MVYGAQKKKQDSTVALLDFLTTKPMTFSVSRESLHCSTEHDSSQSEKSVQDAERYYVFMVSQFCTV